MSGELTAQHERAMLDGSYVSLLKKSALIWLAVGAVMYSQDIVRALYWGEMHPFKEGLYWTLACVISTVLTPWIIWATLRWPVELRNSLKHVGLHILFSVAFGIVRAAIESVLLLPLQIHEYFGPRPNWAKSLPDVFTVLALYDLMSGIIAYWIIVSIQATRLYYQKFQERAQQAMSLELDASELRAQVAQAQLSALKMQLQPHFLFNTLNAIVVLVRQQRGKQAEDALTRFSDLLRAVLEDIDEQEVPLHREIAYLQLYLSIEQMRFPDRLQVSVIVDPTALDAAVPHMGLQPLVENAVRHGIAPCARGGTITIKAIAVGDQLRVAVSDDGVGFSRAASVPGHGLGLKNLCSRLQQLYSGEAQLLIESAQGTSVTMVLPYRVHATAVQHPGLVGMFVEDVLVPAS